MTEGVRIERAAIAADLRAQGLKQREIGERMGLSRSYVNALLNDPTGAQDKARKESYGGICLQCGGPTNGYDGPGTAADYCWHCAPGVFQKIWTPEVIIEAVREWARRRGRAPQAKDWTRASTDPDGYVFPAATTCYRGKWVSGNPSAFFDNWADVIEAAGFPRPHADRNYVNKKRWSVENMGQAKMSRDYLVFTIDEEGKLSLFKEVEARTTAEAVESNVDKPGRYAAVAKTSLHEYTVAPRLVATVVRNGPPEA